MIDLSITVKLASYLKLLKIGLISHKLVLNSTHVILTVRAIIRVVGVIVLLRVNLVKRRQETKISLVVCIYQSLIYWRIVRVKRLWTRISSYSTISIRIVFLQLWMVCTYSPFVILIVDIVGHAVGWWRNYSSTRRIPSYLILLLIGLINDLVLKIIAA